jgi:Ca-activated chloride channel homolog
MFVPTRLAIVLALFAASCASAQSPLATAGMRPSSTTSLSSFDQSQVDFWMNNDDAEKRRKMVENLSDSVSKLDLKAPGSARREYEKGTQLLRNKNFPEAVEHLSKSLSTYPSFVAAHNALGSAYLDMGQNEKARDEFQQSVTLDGHLPHSYMNLGRAQLALKDFSAAEKSMQTASGLAPIDLNLLSALTYAQFLNKNYSAAIATAQQVHSRKHESAAIVHYFAAAAWQGQNNLEAMISELQIFLLEDPKSSAADTARGMIEQTKTRLSQPAESVKISYSAVPGESDAAPDAGGRRALQQLEQKRQLAEVEAEPESACETCALTSNPISSTAPGQPPARVVSRSKQSGVSSSTWMLHSRVNEVALFFAATENGKSVSDLTRQEVNIRDNGKPPALVTAFRNESQLPLRLGLVIDTSASITKQFAFEQKAAASFLKKTVVDQHDLAFVVGFSSAVLLVQDFTGDDETIAHGIDQLAPSGGTALWDAVKFASEKLASRQEPEPVAKILVVISDGDDNSSSATLKQAIESAERNEIIVYAVSTREFAGETANAQVADRAMKVLASRTGGASFFPDSLSNLDRRLEDLQEVIRSRYLISYRPAHFQANGKYRSIAVVAQKSGHKLRVYSRRGYYANAGPATESP